MPEPPESPPSASPPGSGTPQSGLFPVGCWLAGRVGLVLLYALIAWGLPERVLSEPFAIWDGRWYLELSREGYSWQPELIEPQNPAFFPLWPLHLTALGAALPASWVPPAGAVAASLYFLAALIVLWRTFPDAMALQERRTTILLIALFPTTLYFSLLFAESLFLLLSLLLFACWQRERIGWACLFAFLAALSRPNGWLPAAAILGAALILGTQRTRAASVFAAGCAGLLAFLLYCGIALGDPMAPIAAQRGWGVESFTFFQTYLGNFAAVVMWEGRFSAGLAIDGTWALGTVILAAFVIRLRELPLEWRLYGLLAALFPVVLNGGEGFRAAVRQTSVIFPVWAGLALMLSGRPTIRWAVLGLWLILLTAASARYFMGHWVQ